MMEVLIFTGGVILGAGLTLFAVSMARAAGRGDGDDD